MICFAVNLSPCEIFKMSARTFPKSKKYPDFTSLHRKIVYESSKRKFLKLNELSTSLQFVLPHVNAQHDDEICDYCYITFFCQEFPKQ